MRPVYKSMVHIYGKRKDQTLSAGHYFTGSHQRMAAAVTGFGSLLLIGYYIAFFAFMFILKNDLNAMAFQLGWALCLPAVCIILNYLAFRAIYRDELMVKAADRLR